MTRTILVVDDQEEIRQLLRDLLEDQGYLVFEAVDGFDAVAIAEAVTLDLLITDLLMPVQEGIETIREMRKRQPGLSIIAMSGAVEPSYLRAARLLGAHDCLRKPFANSDVLSKVAALLA